MSGRVVDLARDLLARAEGQPRYVFAIVGPPGAGKSTLAEALVAALEGLAPGKAALMPMDGFHYDNAVLDARGMRPRKGAPQTFDVDGLVEALARVKRADRPVTLPVFDRDLDLARAGARIVFPETPLVVLEGNYLLLDESPWDQVAPMLDRTLFLDVPEAVLARRLVDRWLHHGLGPDAARARAEGNDLPNARLVIARSRPADLRWDEQAVPQ